MRLPLRSDTKMPQQRVECGQRKGNPMKEAYVLLFVLFFGLAVSAPAQADDPMRGPWKLPEKGDANGGDMIILEIWQITDEPVCEPTMDGNGDLCVDLADFQIFATCLSGPDAAADPACCMYDANKDDHVDILDFLDDTNGFLAKFSGPCN